MSGSFTWDAIVRIGTIKPYEKALVLTVFHTLDSRKSLPRSPERPAWNTIVCFKDNLRTDIVEHLSPGDLVHFQGYVRTSTFTDDADAKRPAVRSLAQTHQRSHRLLNGPLIA
jgi:single-stranded DNA-binding protein